MDDVPIVDALDLSLLINLDLSLQHSLMALNVTSLGLSQNFLSQLTVINIRGTASFHLIEKCMIEFSEDDFPVYAFAFFISEGFGFEVL